MAKMEKNGNQNERPIVRIGAQTASYAEVYIGEVRIVAGNERIYIECNGVKVEVQP